MQENRWIHLSAVLKKASLYYFCYCFVYLIGFPSLPPLGGPILHKTKQRATSTLGNNLLPKTQTLGVELSGAVERAAQAKNIEIRWGLIV